MRIWFEV